MCIRDRLYASRLADEEWGEDQRDGSQQLHEHVERRPGGVLERVTDRIADDGRRVRVGALAQDVPLVVLEVARLDVLLRVVPRAATVVEDRGEEDAGDRANHEHAGVLLATVLNNGGGAWD